MTYRKQAAERNEMRYICDDHCWFGDHPGPYCDEEMCNGRTLQDTEWKHKWDKANTRSGILYYYQLMRNALAALLAKL